MSDASILSSGRDSAISRGLVATSKPLLVISGIVVVGTALFIVALGLALGLGFGLGLNNESSRTATSRLTAPTVNCDVSSSTCGCASSKPSFTPRIIGGDTAVTNSWPWLVYLVMNNQKTCTGFLISQRHILTAASCVNGYAYNVTVTLGTNNYQFTFGSINITNSTSFAAMVLGDIAVVTLGTNVTYSSTVRPCCLSSNTGATTVGTNGVIAGWGETSTNTLGTPAPTLQQAVVQIRDQSVCSTSSSNDTLCASYNTISTCPADAGGPLMVNNNNAWTCVGIITGKTSCSNPIIFTRVAAYSTLIFNVTGILIT